mgnify:CR=1 FL=1
MSFADFKKQSMNSIEDLQKKLEASSNKDSFKDDRFWRPELDKASNGYAVIRFLPAPPDEELPWAKYYSHAFQGPGGWFIENSRTTLGEKDPVSEMNTLLWNSGVESDKDIARNRKRKLSYVSNILVIGDPSNPENEGKVFLYRYGKKIFEKIQEAAKPEFEDEEKINPFDFWAGADFKLKVRKVAGYINYDKSEFTSQNKLFEGDDALLEEIWNKQYSLTQFIDPSNFKSYDELKTKLHSVIGDDIRGTFTTKTPTVEDVATDESEDDTSSSSDGSEEPSGEDALSYFEKLANE